MLKKIAVAAVAGVATFGLVGCSEDSSAAASSSYCAYTIGNGEYINERANDRNVKQIIRPGQVVGYNDDYDNARYFPCGPRNYRVTPGGDSENALTARTANNIPVDVWLSVYWTPNQGDQELPQFITFCEKYQCATGEPGVDGANFSSPGWNGMLAENMRPTLQRIAERAFAEIPDTVWQNNSAEDKDLASALMEKEFSAEFAKTTGFTDDIICGSGSGGPPDNFNCENVRIVVDVVYAQGGMQQQAADAAAQQRQRDLKQQQAEADLNYTNRVYGELAEEYRACRDLGQQCQMVLGPNSVSVRP